MPSRKVAGRNRRFARSGGYALVWLVMVVLPACAQDPVTHPHDVRALIAQSPAELGPRFRPLGQQEIAQVIGSSAATAPPVYRLGQDDVLHIWGDTDFLRDFGETSKGEVRGTRIKPDGKVYLPVIGAVPAQGRTVIELQDDLRKRLTKYKENPFISVDLLEARSQKFYVLGAVGSPGVFPVDGRVTLLEGFSRAGGAARGSDLENAYVVRQSRILPISLADIVLRGDLSRNIRMAHGDFIFVPSLENGEVYVLGEVAKPGPVPLRKGRLSLVAALAAAGDMRPETADMNVIRIFRGHGCAPQAFTVAACEAYALGTDLELHPGDRIVVAPRELATFERSLRLLQPFITVTTQAAITALGVDAALDGR